MPSIDSIDTEQENQDSQENQNEKKPQPFISQVAAPSKINRWIATLLFGGLIVAILISMLFSGKKETPSHDASIKTDYNMNAPNAPAPAEVQQTQQQQLSTQINALKTSLNAGTLAAQEKLYRMRQAAPIEMYALSTATPSDTLDDVSSSDSNSRLPLSASQVAKLKRLMGDQDPNSQFQNKVSNDSVTTAVATPIPHLDFTVTQGTLIPGALQTAIDSSLPGMVKANVTLDVYAAAGNKILIPKGSTLIGQYNAGLSLGQRRVFVVWTRLIRPDGIDVMLGSPGTDSLGRAGLGADVLETHFWARFGQASLLSIIGASIANAGVSNSDQYNSASAYREALSTNFQQSSNSTLASTFMIKPTLHIYQGARINVFVNRDLSFYSALKGSTQ